MLKNKNISILDKETFTDYCDNSVIREAKEIELYALWMNKKNWFNADLRSHSWENSIFLYGNISGID